jgi:UDP-perosamine 4-acetyltransferase
MIGHSTSTHAAATPLILLGAGGHARVLIETLRLKGEYVISGLLDPRRELHGTQVCEVTVLGDDAQLPALYEQGVRHALLALGSVGKTTLRAAIYARTVAAGFTLIRLVHPRASVSPSAELGDGTVVLNGAIVGAGARLGKNVIVNTAAVIEHDCVVGDHTHIATRACLTGGVTVGANAHIGANAVIRQGISIGAGAVVGAGAAVVHDVAPETTVVGVPARPIRKRG